jgi:hypothetical protein
MASKKQYVTMLSFCMSVRFFTTLDLRLITAVLTGDLKWMARTLHVIFLGAMDFHYLVWDAIALHTSPGIAEHKEAEVALLNYGVALDVVGRGYEHLSEQHREDILKQFPRTGFKKNVIPTFFQGFKHKTDTTYGSINADICAYMIPDFQRKNFCDSILNSPWSE